MSDHEPDRTVPRTPPAPEYTADHIPADDTAARAADESSADPDRTAARQPSDPPAPGGTVVRTPSDVARLEEGAQASAAEGVPGYVLLGELGRGGMGVVHKARHVKLNRVVALKMMLGGARVGRSDLIRFLAEAEAVAAIEHENVVQVYDYGDADGRPYMALEFCPGGTLGGALKTRESVTATTSARDAAKLVARVARGVAAAHALGIVHRDLKPANVFLDAAGVPKVADFGLAKRGDGSDVTQAGQVMGTPAYMSPEQAKGESKFVGPQADVWALGVIFYEALTGARPFTGTVQEILAKVQNADPVAPRKAVPAVPRDLELICLKCLAKAAHERYATAKELADDLDRFGRGEPILARPAGVLERAYKWARRNPGRAGALAAGVLVLVGAAGAANAVRNQRVTDQLAAADLRADDRIAAEEKRQADLRAADEKRAADLKAADDKAKQKQRKTKADALVDALTSADTAGVPRLIDDLKEYRDLTGPKLRELAAQPVTMKPGLHARLARAADEPARAGEVAAYLPACRPDELLPVVQLLKPHAGAVAPGLWAVLTDAKADAGKRVRAACALAGLTPDDARWKAVAAAVTDAVVRANPVEFVAWSAALEPVRGVLVPELMTRYPVARAEIESGKLEVSKLAGAVSRYDLTANLLAQYAKDRPAELAELALIADPRHYTQFAGALQANKAAVVPVLKAELAKKPPEGLPNDTLDAALETHGKRRGLAAAVLLTLGEAEAVWPVFAFPKDGDPTARSYLQERLAAIGADPAALVRRFGAEGNVSVKRALLIALGDFPPELVPAEEREPFVSRLLVLYRDDPDSGLHGAIDWLLRQKWGKAKELAAIDAELARAARGRVAARALAGAVPPGPLGAVVGPQLPAPRVAVGKDWFVNGEGQTYAVVRGPVEFMLGSPESEPGRFTDEPAHRKRIGRSFAIGTKEVTVAEFLRFRPKHSWSKQYSPDQDTPAVAMTWYAAAEYCNWLSAREGIPREQWCYEPNKDGAYGEGMRMKVGHLGLTGYRLPTEVEWEYACRSGSVTARYFGRGDGLLPRYGWFDKNAESRAWPVGQLRPNDRGLFDALGNAMEWVEDPALRYVTGQKEDTENSKYISIDERISRLLRGGSFYDRPVLVRSALRYIFRPGNRIVTYGFRPVRTLVH